MAVSKEHTIPLQADPDVVRARQLVRQWAEQLNFSLVDQTKLVTAASELARNTVIHAGGGEMRIQVLNDGIRAGLQLVFEDRGPGIPDIELAMKDGYTTGSGLGLGLGGSKRLSNEFEIESKAGKGTKIVIRRWK